MTESGKHKILIFLAVILAVFIAFSAAVMVFVSHEMKQEFGRAERAEYSAGLRYTDYEAGYPRSEISFYSGDNLLKGYLYGEGNTDGIVVISHGIGGGGEDYFAETLSFVNAGFQVLAFNNTGSYDSEGEGTTGLTQSYLDLDAALDFVESEERFKGLSVYLYGHSWGGYAVAAVLREGHDIAAAVSVAGYENPSDMIKEWVTDSMGYITAQITVPYIAAYNFFKFGTASNLSAVKSINSTDTPILIAHGINDEMIGFNTASIISHRDEITNPNAEYIICDKIGRDGHNTLYMSQYSVTYRLRKNEEAKALREQYNGDIPDEVLREFYDSIDREEYNMLDDEFMQRVVNFFHSHKKDNFLSQLLGEQ